jgi:hypothetical protein
MLYNINKPAIVVKLRASQIAEVPLALARAGACTLNLSCLYW